MSKIVKCGDIGTPERHARGELKMSVRGGLLMAEKRRISVHSTMLGRGYITQSQYDAAEKFWQIDQGIKGYNNCEYSERTGGGKQNFILDTQLDCIDAKKRAIKQLYTTEQTLIAHVVINDRSPTTKNMPSPKRKEKMRVLKSGLDKLARYYGFV